MLDAVPKHHLMEDLSSRLPDEANEKAVLV